MSDAAHNTQLAMLARSRRPKKHAHWWIATVAPPLGTHFTAAGSGLAAEVCDLCGLSKADYEARQRRSHTGSRSGKDGERLVAAEMGMTRVGQFLTPVDVESTWAVGQVKTGQRFSQGDMNQLDRMTPYANGRMRLLFKVNRPGSGKPKQVQVMVRLSELMAEFGDVVVLTDMEDWPQWKLGKGRAE